MRYTVCRADTVRTWYKNAVETYDAPNHNRKEYNEIAFKIMEQNGIKLI